MARTCTVLCHASSPAPAVMCCLRLASRNISIGTACACVVLQGTAATQAAELSDAYGLDVVRVPPHRPSARIDHPLKGFMFQQVGG